MFLCMFSGQWQVSKCYGICFLGSTILKASQFLRQHPSNAMSENTLKRECSCHLLYTLMKTSEESMKPCLSPMWKNTGTRVGATEVKTNLTRIDCHPLHPQRSGNEHGAIRVMGTEGRGTQRGHRLCREEAKARGGSYADSVCPCAKERQT